MVTTPENGDSNTVAHRETVCKNQLWQSVEAILVQPVGRGCVNKVVVVGQHLYTFTKSAERGGIKSV